MDYVVIDTDVWSFLYKGDSRAKWYEPHLQGKTLCVSFQTVGELYRWAEARRWGASRTSRMELTLRQFVVIPYDNAIARAWARLSVERQRAGHPISAQDAWIAACALRHGCPLATHNASDYAGISGLTIIADR